MVYVRLRVVNNEGHVNWKTKYLLGCILSSIQGLYMNLHTYYSLHIHYIWNKFGCDHSKRGYIIRRTTYFLAYISPSIQGIFLKLYTYHLLCTPCKWFKFSCNRSITKGTLLGEQHTSLDLSHFPFEDFYETPYTSFTGHALQIV